jgi:hypothetical protein
LERLTVIVDINTVLFAETFEEESSNPDLVCCTLGTSTEDLELPLSHGYLGVYTLVVNASIEAEV